MAARLFELAMLEAFEPKGSVDELHPLLSEGGRRRGKLHLAASQAQHLLRCFETGYDRVREIDVAINEVRRLRVRRLPLTTAWLFPRQSSGRMNSFCSSCLKRAKTKLFGPFILDLGPELRFREPTEVRTSPHHADEPR
jgi:hypothetical protein